MTTIIPIKGSATSGLLDVWQSHIQQQQADKAQAGAKAAGGSANGTAAQAGATKANADANAATPSTTGSNANAAGASNVTNATNASNATDSGDTPPTDGEKMLSSLRAASDGAKQAGKAMAGGGASDASGAGNPIVAQTIKKLKEMLAKVMAQLDAVRNNDRLPPEEKLQQVNTLSAEAMSIQAQITALMDPTKTTGTRINTTA